MGLTPWKMRKLRSHVFSSKPYAGFRMLPFCRKRQLSGVHMENYTRERWSLPFAPPARRAVLRRRRQRDSSLWTPFHRLRAGRICPFICAASARQKDGGPKGRLRHDFPDVSIAVCLNLSGRRLGRKRRKKAVGELAGSFFRILL